MLSLRDVSVHYDGTQALWGIDIDVEDGEIVALVGSNGAGKSTTLRAISGLVRLSGGVITYRGQRLDNRPSQFPVECGIAHVPEGRQIFPEMTVRENLRLGAFLKTARVHLRERLDYVFELLPRLEERDRQLAGTMSGGEQQMLAIGRALMLGPQLIMLDEPSLGLSPAMTTFVFETVERISAAGVTVLLVEQNLTHALALASRAYVLENGHVTMSGAASDIASDPHIRRAYLGL